MFIRIFEKNTRSDRIFFRSAVGGGAKRRPDLVGIGSQRSAVGGHWSLVTGHWSLVNGHWSLVIGHWSLVIWTMDNALPDPQSWCNSPRHLY